MGAPLRNWIFRVVLTLTAAAIAAGVWLSGMPLAMRLIALAILAATAVGQMFRYLPAFDPLGRIRWRLPLHSPRSPRSPAAKVCALTFDDGPTAATTTVLDILAAEQVPATFFVLGANVERHPDIVRRAHGEGHTVGIHGMTHEKLVRVGEETIERHVAGVTTILERLGVPRPKVYRTPHGIKSRRVFEVVRRHGLTLWAWSRGIWDTDRPEPAVLVRRATRLAQSGMVLLLHDGRGDEPQPDVQSMLTALPAIIRELKQRGFAFVRVGDS